MRVRAEFTDGTASQYDVIYSSETYDDWDASFWWIVIGNAGDDKELEFITIQWSSTAVSTGAVATIKYAYVG